MMPVSPVAALLLIVAATQLLAAAFFPALTWGASRRFALLMVLGAAVLASPCLIPPGRPFLRFLAAVNAISLAVKLYDLDFAARRGIRPRLSEFLAFLPNFGSLVLRRLPAEPRPTARQNLSRLVLGGAGLTLGVAVLAALFRVDWDPYPFAVEHSAKLLGFYVALLPGVAALAAGWRLLGGRLREPMQHPLAARTPADFWRRYNRPVQQFFYENVFKPAGGLRAPVRATLLVFALSAVIHEYVFGIAIGRVQGYQTLFFLLQGVAVVATLRFKPRGAWALPWVAATLAFNLATGVLFFASMNGLLPFYAHSLPGWLKGW
jgi:hypothetical protein